MIQLLFFFVEILDVVMIAMRGRGEDEKLLDSFVVLQAGVYRLEICVQSPPLLPFFLVDRIS